MTRFWIVTAALVLLVTACDREVGSPPSGYGESASSQNPAGEPEFARVGGRMPSYTTSTLDGVPISLSDPDKLTLVNIWATWCGPCRYEIPELKRLQEKYRSRGFEIVGVSIDQQGAERKVRDFARTQGLNYPVTHDPDGRIADLFRASVIPTSALIDRDGTILWIETGIIRADDRELTEILEKAL